MQSARARLPAGSACLLAGNCCSSRSVTPGGRGSTPGGTARAPRFAKATGPTGLAMAPAEAARVGGAPTGPLALGRCVVPRVTPVRRGDIPHREGNLILESVKSIDYTCRAVSYCAAELRYSVPKHAAIRGAAPPLSLSLTPTTSWMYSRMSRRRVWGASRYYYWCSS